jgi:hypothetical protein
MDTVETFKQWFAENKDNLNIPRLEDLPEDDDWVNDNGWDEVWEQTDER